MWPMRRILFVNRIKTQDISRLDRYINVGRCKVRDSTIETIALVDLELATNGVERAWEKTGFTRKLDILDVEKVFWTTNQVVFNLSPPNWMTPMLLVVCSWFWLSLPSILPVLVVLLSNEKPAVGLILIGTGA